MTHTIREHIKEKTMDNIHARIRRSLDDPRPNLSLEDVDEALEALFARAEKD